MIPDQQTSARRMSAFEIYLRTGLLVKSIAEAEAISVKFNPWHDPRNGQFTNAGAGVRYGDVPHSPKSAKPRPGKGGGFGGGGASGTWANPTHPKPTAKGTPATAAAQTPPHSLQQVASASAAQGLAGPEPAQFEIHHTLRSNGYSFDIDKAGRTPAAHRAIFT